MIRKPWLLPQRVTFVAWLVVGTLVGMAALANEGGLILQTSPQDPVPLHLNSATYSEDM